MAFGRISLYLSLALTGTLTLAETVGTTFGSNPQRPGAPTNLVPARTSDPDVPWKLVPLDEPILGNDKGPFNYVPGDEADVAEKLRIYQLVVVIDKGTRPQTLTAYYDANAAQVSDNPDNATKEQKVVMGLDHVKVSTGLEDAACEGSLTSARDAQGHQWYGQVKPYWHHTEDGYYVVHDDRSTKSDGKAALDIDHNSSDFDAPMPYAVGFDKESETYTHIGESDTQWGRPQSHGCVRMQPSDARDLFTMVQMTGGPINPEDPMLNAHCPPKTPDCQMSDGHVQTMRNFLANNMRGAFPGVRTEDNQQIQPLRTRLPRLTPNNPGLGVPLMDRSGNLLKDASGNLLRTPPGTGYSTLYIVKDSSKQTQMPNVVSTNSGQRVNTTVKVPRQPVCDPGMLAQLNAARAQKYGWQQPQMDTTGAPVVNQGQIETSGGFTFPNIFQNSGGNNGPNIFQQIFGQQPPPTPPRPVKGGRNQ